jgi:hypothetical protein
MAYITDGKEKNYHGIKTDRFLSRTWIVEDSDKVFHHLKWYPSKMFRNKVMRFLTGINVPEIRTHDWRSKLPVTILPQKSERRGTFSNFPYQDCSCFMQDDNDSNEVYIEGESDCDTWLILLDSDEDVVEVTCEDPYVFNGGIDILISEGRNLYEIGDIEYQTCEECGSAVRDDDSVYDGHGNQVCQSCFDQNHIVCEHCHDTGDMDDAHEVDGNYVCDYCFDRHYVVCEYTSENILTEDSVEVVDSYDDDVYVSKTYLEENKDEFIYSEGKRQWFNRDSGLGKILVEKEEKESA